MKNKLIVNCEQLYNNCIYSSVAHAIFVLKAPLFNYTQSWDGINYNFNYLIFYYINFIFFLKKFTFF